MGISFCVSLHSLFSENDPISLEVVEDEHMRFDLQDVRKICKTRDYIDVVEIHSIDNDERFKKRNLQRETCWSCSEVASKVNNFSGKLLIVYGLSPHTNKNCELREVVKGETDLNQDVIILPVCDVNPTSTKKLEMPEIGGGRQNSL